MKKLHVPYIQITQAAFHIYAAEGPKGFTMRKLAAALGIRASALYKHFGNKEAILDAVAAAADRTLADKLRAPKKQKAKDQMRPLLGRALEFAVEQPRLFRLATAAIWAQICGLAAIRERGDLPAESRALKDRWFQTAQPVVDGLRPATPHYRAAA
jgi:AcrR family transcriptional regulator